MDRRNFLCRLTAATASGVGSAAADAGPKNTRTVTYPVKGFTCITCAVGLEVMLRGLKGVTRANASYPQATVVIEFDDHTIHEDGLKQFIQICGFTVADDRGRPK